jgi:hypothetical protein
LQTGEAHLPLLFIVVRVQLSTACSSTGRLRSCCGQTNLLPKLLCISTFELRSLYSRPALHGGKLLSTLPTHAILASALLYIDDPAWPSSEALCSFGHLLSRFNLHEAPIVQQALHPPQALPPSQALAPSVAIDLSDALEALLSGNALLGSLPQTLLHTYIRSVPRTRRFGSVTRGTL